MFRDFFKAIRYAFSEFVREYRRRARNRQRRADLSDLPF